MNITELSVKRPSILVVVFSILVFFGIYGYRSLTYELLPDISTPVLTISTAYPGATPKEVESAVTKPIENVISSLENLEGTQAISMESFSTVIVELKYGTDVDVAVQDAQRKLDAILSRLPEDITEPSIGKFSFDEMPIIRLGATSTLSDIEFTKLMDEYVQPEISRIEGVAQVHLIGGATREIKINVNREKLRHHNLSILQVSQAISRANLNFPTGSIANDDQDILVRLSGRFSNLDQIRKLVVSTDKEGSHVLLQDLAEVFDTKEESATISRINGKPSLGLTISKQSDGNTVEVSEKVQILIAQLEERYSENGLKFEIAGDSSVFTLEAANHVINDLVLAVFLVAFIMLFFLHSIRNALIVMVAIPISVIATFAVMSVAGFTLNLMTLLALSLVIGILVDDSIVVLENIQARMEDGASARQAAKDTWKQIGMSVLSITLVIVVVFLPIGLVSGIIADLLRQFSLVVVAATLISLLVSFTITPWLASRFSKVIKLDNKKLFHLPLIGFEKLIKSFENFYSKLLNWSLKHKRITLGAIFALVIASLTLFTGGFIGSEFVANGDNGEFIIKMEFPKETPLEANNKKTIAVEEYLLKQEDVTNIFSTVGQSSGAMSTNSTAYMTEINVKLCPAEERSFTSDEFARKTKDYLNKSIAGVKFSAAATSMVGGGTAAPVQIIVQGTKIDELIEFGEHLVTEVQKIPGTAEVKSTVEGGNPELNVNVNRQKMSDLGITLDMVGATMQNAFTGNTDTRFQDGEYEYDIRVQLDQFDRMDRRDVQNLTFMSNTGDLVHLEQFADIETSSGPSRLDRKDKMPSLTVESQAVGRDIASLGEEIQEVIGALEIPAGISVKQGGDLENQAEAFGSLAFALLTSILLVYLIMVALYDNYIYPLVVMLSIPVALIGAFLALALAMENMSIFGMLGLIMLVGLVVKNAILIVDFVNQLKKEGMERNKAIIFGTLKRFRPILMTTIAMVIAMIPVALASGAGSEWKNGLAWVLIGGLSSSMLLTMIIVPVAYQSIDELSERITKRVNKLKAKRIKSKANLTLKSLN